MSANQSLSTNEIIDCLESDSNQSLFDDSDQDPDYIEDKKNKGSSSDEDDDIEQEVETVVVFHPQAERADGGSDQGSDDSDEPSCPQSIFQGRRFQKFPPFFQLSNLSNYLRLIYFEL